MIVAGLVGREVERERMAEGGQKCYKDESRRANILIAMKKATVIAGLIRRSISDSKYEEGLYD